MSIGQLTDLSVSARERWQLARAVIAFQSLMAWDQAWTGAAEIQEPLSGDGALLLPVLAGELHRGLGDAHDGAVWLHDFVLTTGPSLLSEALAERATDARGDDISDLAELLDEWGGNVGGLVETGYTGFIEAEAAEHRSINEKLTAILAGNGGGDLSLRMRCNIADLTIVGGLISAFIPPHVLAAPIIAAGSTARKTWGCGRLDGLAAQDEGEAPGNLPDLSPDWFRGLED